MLTLILGDKNYSSWSLRPWLALKRCGAPFREVVLRLGLPSSKAEILQYSPTGKVPALLDENLLIWESLAICEYLAEKFPEARLWPTHPAARALARAVSAEMHAGFSLLRQNMPMDIRSSKPDQGRAPGVSQDIDRIAQIWRQCRAQHGQNGPFLFGEFSIADAMFAPVVTRFRTHAVSLDEECQRYADAVWQLPEMQEWAEAARQEPPRA